MCGRKLRKFWVILVLLSLASSPLWASLTFSDEEIQQLENSLTTAKTSLTEAQTKIETLETNLNEAKVQVNLLQASLTTAQSLQQEQSETLRQLSQTLNEAYKSYETERVTGILKTVIIVLVGIGAGFAVGALVTGR